MRRLIACTQPPSTAERNRPKQRRPTPDVGKLHPKNATVGSVAVVACLVQGLAQSKMAATYETFSAAAKTLGHAARHAERWWRYSSPLAKSVISVATKLQERLVRHLPEHTASGQLQSLPIPIVAKQAIERSRAMTPGLSAADRRAAVRRAAMARPHSVAGTSSRRRRASASRSMSSLHAGNGDEDGEPSAMLDFTNPDPGSFMDTANEEEWPGEFLPASPQASDFGGGLSAVSGMTSELPQELLSRAGMSAVEQRVVAEEWSRRDQLASRGRARAASGASRSAGFEGAVQQQATRLAPIS